MRKQQHFIKDAGCKMRWNNGDKNFKMDFIASKDVTCIVSHEPNKRYQIAYPDMDRC